MAYFLFHCRHNYMDGKPAKRQRSLLDFFGKQAAGDDLSSSPTSTLPADTEPSLPSMASSQETERTQENDEKGDVDETWSAKQKLIFMQANEWLIIKNGKLGCSFCRDFKHRTWDHTVSKVSMYRENGQHAKYLLSTAQMTKRTKPVARSI